ncbi:MULTISPECIES: hypothetical protein [Streptomyces violaceusniger group]|uniref:Uncharacterized protein n=2 Tax=Streptomyces rhizosphaericus TaxID=114699 RepID=A0ABP4AWI0_9ACTN|nr:MULTISPECIES: hypothetical protein [Streptomyces violaceusniger group]
MKFDADTGRLDVVPDAPACGTKLRWSAPKPTAAADAEAPGSKVRTVHVLSPAPGDVGSASAVADPDLWPAAPEAPVRAREAASPGDQQAPAARQARACRSVSSTRGSRPPPSGRTQAPPMREPEKAFGDGQAAIEELRAKTARAAAAGGGRGQQSRSRAAASLC